MSRPAVAVAMCTYNGSAYIAEQLHSIAEQTRRPDALLVVDDRSTDDTVARVEAFAGSAPFPVRVVVNERNLGYRRNFEKAIGLCEGEIVLLADQDDVWYPHKVGALTAAFQSSPEVTLAFSDADLVDAQLRPLGTRLWEAAGLDDAARQMFRAGRGLEALLKRNLVTGATVALRASARDRVLPLPEGSDHDAWAALVLASLGRVVAVEEPLIAYRQHGGNQIGMARPTRLGRWRRARQQQRTVLARFLRELQALRGRIATVPGVDPLRLQALDEAIFHLGERLALPRARPLRLPTIYREFVSGRYARRANGLSSALRDLII